MLPFPVRFRNTFYKLFFFLPSVCRLKDCKLGNSFRLENTDLRTRTMWWWFDPPLAARVSEPSAWQVPQCTLFPEQFCLIFVDFEPFK